MAIDLVSQSREFHMGMLPPGDQTLALSYACTNTEFIEVHFFVPQIVQMPFFSRYIITGGGQGTGQGTATQELWGYPGVGGYSIKFHVGTLPPGVQTLAPSYTNIEFIEVHFFVPQIVQTPFFSRYIINGGGQWTGTQELIGWEPRKEGTL